MISWKVYPPYRLFIWAIKARNTYISYDDLYALLLSEEPQLKLENLSIENTVPPTAHYVHTTTTSRGRGGRGHGRGCSFSHLNSSSRFSTTIICHNCNGNGHIACQCPSLAIVHRIYSNPKPTSILAATHSLVQT